MLSSNSVMVAITIVSVVIGVMGLMIGIIPALKAKGVNVDQALNNATNVINKADSVLQVVKDVLPANPIVNILETIEKLAKFGVGSAEQLSHAGTISKDQRITVANDIISSGLQKAGITVDDSIQKLIDAAVRTAVNDLGHADPDVKQLQDTIDQQNVQNSQLQNENTQLKNTITSIQTTAQSVQASAQ